ncbi:MAG: hypothetical protein ACFB0B_06660 [Thermonemataceae bacterium]
MKKIFFTICSLWILNNTYAQTHLGIGFQMIFPTEAYREATNDVGVGGGFNIWVPFAREVPVFFGLDFGYSLMGTNERRINAYANIIASNGQVLGTIPINYRIRTNNNFLHTHAGIRVKAPLPMVQPYAEGLIGFNYLYTRTKIFDESPNNSADPDQDTQITASNQLSDFAFSYGAGGGVMLKLGGNIGLDLRVVYLIGNDADYYRDEDIEQWEITLSNPNPNGVPQEAEVEDSFTTSATNVFYANLGLVIAF